MITVQYFNDVIELAETDNGDNWTLNMSWGRPVNSLLS